MNTKLQTIEIVNRPDFHNQSKTLPMPLANWERSLLGFSHISPKTDWRNYWQRINNA